MARRRRRRKWKRLALLALAILVYLLLPGILESPGSGGSDADPRDSSRGSAGTDERSTPAPQDKEPTGTVPTSDLVAGRAARLSFLLSELRFAAAGELARAMAKNGNSAREQEIGLRYLDRIAEAGRHEEHQWRVAVRDRRYGEAERRFRRLRKHFPDRAGPILREMGSRVGSHEANGDAALQLGQRLGPSLPLPLGEDGFLWSVDGRKALLKVPGPFGGYRYQYVDVVELDPVRIHHAVRERVGQGATREILVLFAGSYLAADRPIAAALVLGGELRLRPAVVPGSAPQPGGRR